MIRECDSPAYKGPEITILTGNSEVTSNLWANVEIAPGRFMQHILLPDTPPTVSVGEINPKLGVAFQWLEPSSDKAGEVFVSKCVTGHEVIEGKFELWPLIVKYYTPERHDLDPIFTVNLHHCKTPGCKCGLPKLDSHIKKLRSRYGTPGKNISIDDADSDAGDAQPPEFDDLLGDMRKNILLITLRTTLVSQVSPGTLWRRSCPTGRRIPRGKAARAEGALKISEEETKEEADCTGRIP